VLTAASTIQAPWKGAKNSGKTTKKQ